MKMVLISDTHGRHNKVSIPEGDILVHAGDLTMTGGDSAYNSFFEWLSELPHEHKIVIGGNHDFGFDKYVQKQINLPRNTLVLHDSAACIGSLKFYGSPYTPVFFDWAYMLPRGRSLYEHWLKIPMDTDVLVTHGPRKGVLDQPSVGGEHCGDEDLGVIIDAIKPKLHVFGHIHGGAGETELAGIRYVNASVVNEAYQPVNSPIVVEL